MLTLHGVALLAELFAAAPAVKREAEEDWA
jgi:hypothetical protein